MLLELNSMIAAALRGLAERSEIIDTLLIFTAEYGAFVIPPTLVILFLLREKNREDSLFVFFATVLGIGLSYAVSGLYVYERPFEMYDTLLSDAVGDTFPSQHASTLFPFSLAFIYRGRKILGLIFLSWSIANTLSRIIVGYHFPLDIFAGLVIGGFAVWSLGQFENWIKKFSEYTERFEKKLLNFLPRIFQERL